MQLGQRKEWLPCLLRAGQQTPVTVQQIKRGKVLGIGPCRHHGNQLIRAVEEQE